MRMSGVGRGLICWRTNIEDQFVDEFETDHEET